jgi:putative tryptophan/tyrosine transport system substrate-binding protein
MVETGSKRLELLTTAVAGAKRVGVLWNYDYPTNRSELREIEQAARLLNLQLIPVDVRAPNEFDPALRALAEQHAGAAIVLAGTIFGEHVQGLADMTAKARLPTIFFARRFVELGGLMSYAADNADTYRRAAGLVDKILKGAKPADLPVQQPTRFELVINLKTAKARGLTVPQALLARADEVIELAFGRHLAD